MWRQDSTLQILIRRKYLRRILAINETKIKYINILGKPYRITNIDFLNLILEASEMDDADIADLPEEEVFSISDFKEYHVILRNWTGKVINIEEYVKKRKMRSANP